MYVQIRSNVRNSQHKNNFKTITHLFLDSSSIAELQLLYKLEWNMFYKLKRNMSLQVETKHVLQVETKHVLQVETKHVLQVEVKHVSLIDSSPNSSVFMLLPLPPLMTIYLSCSERRPKQKCLPPCNCNFNKDLMSSMFSFQIVLNWMWHIVHTTEAVAANSDIIMVTIFNEKQFELDFMSGR
jgi:hypothetical protein